MAKKKQKTGPKPIYGEPMQPQRVMLPPSLIAYARSLGKGNLSAGVRRALEERVEVKR